MIPSEKSAGSAFVPFVWWRNAFDLPVGVALYVATVMGGRALEASGQRAVVTQRAIILAGAQVDGQRLVLVVLQPLSQVMTRLRYAQLCLRSRQSTQRSVGEQLQAAGVGAARDGQIVEAIHGARLVCWCGRSNRARINQIFFRQMMVRHWLAQLMSCLGPT